VGIALLALALALPRRSTPDVLPLPTLDRAERNRDSSRDRERARAVLHDPLPFDVRAVGEAIRRYGRAEAEHDEQRRGSELLSVRRLFEVARRRYGSEPLLRLRAIQSELFERALEVWRKDGSASADLIELGGAFLITAQRFGWIESPHRLVFDEDESRVLFEMRWTGLEGALELEPLTPSLEDWRIQSRALLRHPQTPAAPPDLAEDARNRARLQIVNALAKRDNAYPAELARAVLYSRLGDFARAHDAIRSHLAAHPDGPWTLRARNYALFIDEHVRASSEL
jgi:hypothetical protein